MQWTPNVIPIETILLKRVAIVMQQQQMYI